MQRFIQILVGGLIFLFFPLWTTAQTVIKTAFKQEQTKYYKGRIDDISDITVSLTCEGKNCKGNLIYLRSKDEFKLQGTMKDNRLQLQEFNRANKCTGYLNGKKEGTTIKLTWKNKEGTVGNVIKLKEVGRRPDFPTFCGDNKWINAYSGRIKGMDVDLILHRVDNNRVLGTAYYLDEKKQVQVEGNLSDNNNLHLKFISEETGTEIGSLRGVYKDQQNLSVSFYNEQQSQSFVSFQLKKSLAVSCLEYADYYTNYDFLFPKSKNAVFNEVMVLLTKDWIEDCRKNSQYIRKKTAAAELRASQRAYSWSDVVLLTDEFISGMLTYQATWTQGESTKTFNYNLKTGELIELATIFKKGYNYQLFKKKYIAQEIIKSPIYKNNKGFRNWIKDENFSFFTLGKEGITFYTEFHIIYDRQQITIPYKKLKANIRKNASIRQLF